MRKLMWFTIGGAIACFASVYLLLASNLLVPLIGVGFAFILCLVLTLQWPGLKPIATALLGATVLLGWFLAFRNVYLLPLDSIDGQETDITITLTEYSWETQYGIGIEGYTQIGEYTYRIRGYVNESLSLKPGDTVIGKFVLHNLTKDTENSHQIGEGIYLTAYPRGEIYHRISTELPWFGYPAYIATSIKACIGEIFPEDTLGFAQALLLGDTSLIDYETDTALKISGIRHIVAVSGLHVSILFSLISTILGKKKWLTALFGLPALFLFAAIAGFTPSITRACIMHGLMILAMLFEREYDPPTSLAFSILLMLLVNPFCVASVSLQLSAGCMIGIFLFAQRISCWLLDRSRLGKFRGIPGRFAAWLGQCVSVSISATLATVPLCAAYFGTVSLVSVITNLLTLWVVTAIFYGIILSCILSLLFTPLGIGTAWFVSWLIRYVCNVSGSLASTPISAIYTASIYAVIFLVFCYVLLAVFLSMKRKRPISLLCCMVIGLCLALTLSWTEPLMDDVRLTVLDVGQGQCIILQSEGKTFLIDCGGDSDETTANKAAETLLSMGIFRLDGVILTHYDRDHAGGVEYLLSRVETEVLYLPDCMDSEGYSVSLQSRNEAMLIEEHTQIMFGDASITLITTDFGTTNNESGLCVLFQRLDCDILITGDRNAYAERDLLRQIDISNLEVLIVGHHGSKTSTCVELLEAGTPEIAIISVGENNYGHPTKEVLDRLEQYNCRIYRTDENGTIIYRR